jgi:hypothetical protein
MRAHPRHVPEPEPTRMQLGPRQRRQEFGRSVEGREHLVRRRQVAAQVRISADEWRNPCALGKAARPGVLPPERVLRVTDLNRVEPGQQPLQRGLGQTVAAQQGPRVRRQDQGALGPDKLGRFLNGQPWRNPLVQEKPQHVSVGGGDFLAHDDLYAAQALGFQRTGDFVMVGDRQAFDARAACGVDKLGRRDV